MMKLFELYTSPLAKVLASVGVLLVALLVLKSNVLPADGHRALTNITNGGLNDADLEMRTRNYYREVSDVDVGRFAGTGQFLHDIGLKGPRKQDPKAEEPAALGLTSIVHPGADYLPWELKPNEEIIFLEHPLRTNRWGMRDRDYEQKKLANTFRIAVIGASNSMGNGVAVENCYADVLEEWLNTEFADAGYENYEVLNFSVGGYDLTDRLYVATEKVPAFEPDLVLVVVLVRDLKAAAHQRVAERMSNNVSLHYPFMEEIAQRAGAKLGDRENNLRQQLYPFRALLIKSCVEEMNRLSQRTGATVASLVLNLIAGPPEQELIDSAAICESVGLPTLPIFDAYEGYTGEQVYISANDRHPRPLGHKLIAEELARQLLSHPILGPMIRNEASSVAAGD